MPIEPTPANPPPDPTPPVFFSKGHFVADAPPTSADDQTKGFWAGSTWYVRATNELFMFVPNTTLDGGVWIKQETGAGIAQTMTDFRRLR